MINNNDSEKIRQRNKDLHHAAALHWNTLANQQELELTRQLLTLAGILLTITAPLAALGKEKITPEIRVITVFFWIFLLTSTAAGIIQIFVNINYFIYLLKDELKRTKIWSTIGVDIKEQQMEERQIGETKESSGNIPLIIQTTFICLALLTLVTVGLLFLFSD